ncbi:MAG: hypothetical protein IKI37_11720 [Oscillospiraceae bacterium]|nr:hypothetical protein [Oscillospiraceae bacterium]
MKLRHTRRIDEKMTYLLEGRAIVVPFINTILRAFCGNELIPQNYQKDRERIKEAMLEISDAVEMPEEEIDRQLIVSMLRNLFPPEMDGGILETFLTVIYQKIERLSIEEYENNPYYQNIHFDTVQEEDIVLTNDSYQPYEAFLTNTAEMFLNLPVVLPNIGFFKEQFSFQSIGMKSVSKAMMTITPVEINTMKEPIANAKGKVLMLGCGLGYFAYMASLKEDVESVTIIEKDPAVIKLFTEHILPQFEHKEKIQVTEADALTYLDTLQDGTFDYCFADIWLGADEFALYMAVKDRTKHMKKMKTDYWIEDAFMKQLVSNVFTEIGSAYAGRNIYHCITTEERHKINYLHRLLKNEEITSPEQIDNLLNPETILKRINKAKFRYEDCF